MCDFVFCNIFRLLFWKYDANGTVRLLIISLIDSRGSFRVLFNQISRLYTPLWVGPQWPWFLDIAFKVIACRVSSERPSTPRNVSAPHGWLLSKPSAYRLNPPVWSSTLGSTFLVLEETAIIIIFNMFPTAGDTKTGRLLAILSHTRSGFYCSFRAICLLQN